MVTCPNCGKALEDGAKFCEGCGAQISATVFCPACGAANSAEFAFCQTCGTNMTAAAAPQQAEAPVQEKKNPLAFLEPLKKLPKKVWMFAGIGAAAVVAVVVVLCLLLGGGSKKPNVALYIKDGEIWYNKFSKDGTYELTDRLVDTVATPSNLASMGNRLGSYVRFNKDGSKLFYPDRISEKGITLYCRNPKDQKSEPVKIDSDIEYYIINAAGTKVLYEKDGSLYIHNLKEKEKIASDVSGVYPSKDLSKVVYYTRIETVVGEDTKVERDLYLWKSGSEPQKLVSDIRSLSYVAEDLSVVYYTKDDGTEEKASVSLYKQTVGKDDKVKIAEEIAGVINVYDSGEIYYTKAVESEKTLADFVEDDLAASDAAMTEPKRPVYPERGTRPEREKYPDRPTSPSYPYRYQFSSQAEYDAALAEYNTLKEAYDKELEEYNNKKKEIDDAYTAALQKYNDDYNAAVEAYNKEYDEYSSNLLPAWTKKENRDELRANLKEEKQKSTSYTLYYYNGKESVVVTDAMARSYADNESYEKAVLVVATAEAGVANTVKMSELDNYSIYSVMNKLGDTENVEGTKNLVIGSAISAIEQKAGANFTLADDGSVLYFLDEIDEEKATGDLYKIAISKGAAGAREKLDSDVYGDWISIAWGTSVTYFKNRTAVKSGDEGISYYKGDLYVDGKEVDFDVYMNSVDADDKKVIRYRTDYNAEKKTGTLKQYKDGKAVKIADDVFSYVVQPNGDLLYLNDWSNTRYKGTLNRYTGGKSTKLDEDVSSIIPIYWNDEK